ncbi:MAG TPA: methyltransferase domain-containing protein [Actinomycetota bacterium]|nr:methyltransferase domain-containing protein [Actinomycetota bacterium]
MGSGSAIANVDQARGWDGPEGDNWTDNEHWYNDAVRSLAPHLSRAAAIRASDQVLDIGCGCGQSTREAARAAREGSALGIDLSSRMIARARQRATEEGLANVCFEHGDAQVFSFEPASVDIAVSRFGCMFFSDPVAAFGNVARALRPGGRIALMVWREMGRNEWITSVRDALAAGRDLPEPPPDAPSPVSLADPDRVKRILTEAGFEELDLESVDEPMRFGADAERGFEGATRLSIVTGLLADLDDATRRDALHRLRQALAGRQTPDGVLFPASAWLVRAAKSR